MWALATSCLVVSAMLSPMVALLLEVLEVANPLPWSVAWALLGAAGWTTFVLAATGARIRAASRGVDLTIEADRRVTVDGATTDLSDADSVAILSRGVELYQVVVRDAQGSTLWLHAGLRETHARCLAMDLASAWGLSAPPDLARVPEGAAPDGAGAEFRTDLHGVRIGTWSGSNLLSPTFLWIFPAWMMLTTTGTIGVWAALIFLASFVSLAALVPLFPVRIDLAIDDRALVVRAGWLAAERRIPVTALHPPRIVPDGPHGASLVLRSEDGWSCEIRHRPHAELERIAFWIEHARSEGATKALPEPVPSLPPELARIRDRVRS